MSRKKSEMSNEMKRMRQNYRRRVLRKERREKGLCTRCGKPLDRDGAMCSKCLEKNHELQEKRREWLLASGICPICGINNIFPHEKSCPECKAKKAIAKAENMDYYVEWNRKKIAERRANGLCPICGKRPPDEGYKSCAECREKARKRRIRKEKPYKRNEWMAEGKCAICGKDELVPNKRVCWNCYATRLKATEKGRANTSPDAKKTWIKTNARIRGKYNRNYDKFT